MSDGDFQTAEPVRPHLWNPNAAANWSVLLTPAFGAYLHAANWRNLGKPERAAANMVWVWVTVAFLAIVLGTVFVTESKAIDRVMRLAGLGILAGWYFSQGRSQAKYVKETLGDDYSKRGWRLPLLTGFATVGGYIAVVVVVVVVAMAAYTPHPNELIPDVQRLILQDWQKKPELQGASIQNVTLVHKGGKVYTGFVDATLNGQSERLSLEVVLDRGTITLQLKTLEGK